MSVSKFLTYKTTKTSLAEDPSDLLRKKIVCHFWKKEEPINVADYGSYFDYYKRTCQALFLGFTFTELESLSIVAHEDLLDIADVLWDLSKETPNFDRPQARAALQGLVQHAEQPIVRVNNSIGVFLRLWLTVRIQDKDFSPAAKAIQWDDTSKIQDFIVRSFPELRSHSSDPEIPLESNFTAVNLYRLCGIQVFWTHQLEDHLRYDIENRTVRVYSLSQCLQDHLNWYVVARFRMKKSHS